MVAMSWKLYGQDLLASISSTAVVPESFAWDPVAFDFHQSVDFLFFCSTERPAVCAHTTMGGEMGHNSLISLRLLSGQ